MKYISIQLKNVKKKNNIFLTITLKKIRPVLRTIVSLRKRLFHTKFINKILIEFLTIYIKAYIYMLNLLGYNNYILYFYL